MTTPQTTAHGSPPRDSREIPTITCSDEERNAKTLRPETVQKAAAMFRESGFLRIHNAIPLDYVDEMHSRFLKRYDEELEKTSRPDRRPLYTVDLEGPFNNPIFYANPMFYPIIEELLGKDCIVGACSVVLSFPGAPDQFTHRDTPSLFGDFNYDVHLPTYALTVLMPLVDANLETGSTEVWPKTHLNPNFEKALQEVEPIHPVVPRGSVMMTDSRVIHRGARNRSERIRPLVYNSYHRHWFRDFDGYASRPPIAIDPIRFRQVPEEYKHLFRWRFDQYFKMRIERGAKRIVRDAVPQPIRKPLRAAWLKLKGKG